MSNPFDLIDARLCKIEELLLDIKHPKVQPAPPSDPKRYMTREETARHLGVSLHTLNKWTKEGRIKAYRIGSRVRYEISDIEKSLQAIAV